MHRKSYNVAIMCLIMMVFHTGLRAAEEEEAVKKPPSYVSLGKPMVLNLSTNGKRLTFLQLKADVLVSGDDAKEVVEAHIPAIRHQLIVLLSEQNANDMKTPAKREEIRLQATRQIQDMLAEMADNTDVNEVLFSNFLVQ